MKRRLKTMWWLGAVLIAAILATACSEDNLPLAETTHTTTRGIDYRISMNEALANLNDFLTEGEGVSRAADSRKVATITPVSYRQVCGASRSDVGWKGAGNGYYYSGVFDLGDKNVVLDNPTSVPQNPVNYSKGYYLKTITYKLPR